MDDIPLLIYVTLKMIFLGGQTAAYIYIYIHHQKKKKKSNIAMAKTTAKA